MRSGQDLNSTRWIYLSDFMNRVSRSFAVVVPFLEDPLQRLDDAQRLLFDNLAILDYARKITAMIEANFS